MSLDTRGFDQSRLLPRSMEDRLLVMLGRVAGCGLLAATVLLWASLVSWSVGDPSLTHATTTPAANWLGAGGAIISDLLLQTLGLAIAIALAAPTVWAFELMRGGRLDAGRLRFGLYPVSVLVVAGAVSAYPVTDGWPLHYGLGGALGDGIYTLTHTAFALLNDSRAGLASGIVLTAAALVTAAKAVSLDTVDMARDAADAVRNLLRRRRNAWPSDSFGEAPYEADYEPELPMPDPQRTGAILPSEAGAAVRWWWPFKAARRAAAVPPSVPHGAAWDHAPIHEYPRGQAAEWTSQGWTGPAPGHWPQPRAPMGVIPPPPPPPADGGHSAVMSPAPVPAHPRAQFDERTDAASLDIARRFAPRPAPDNGGSASAVPSPKAAGKTRGFIFSGDQGGWKRPSLNLLKKPAAAKPGPEFTQTVMRGNARLLEDVLADFGVKGEVKDIRPGPVVTLYELEPARGTKSSRVINLADDIARSMSVASVRAAVVSGRNAIGLELPNMRRDAVALRELLEGDAYTRADAALPLALGKGIGGEPIIADLARMPHLLVAGTTGSGKSVGVNAMILSLLYRHAPEDCRLLMIDPKMLELSVYNGIPHLLTPVVTDPAMAVTALNWAVAEMEERYKRMASLNVRNIDVFNNRVRNAIKHGNRLGRTVQTGFDASGQAVFEDQPIDLEAMPRIVIVVDEFADLMMTAGKDVEAAVQRLAQMARAAGIHLIMATQRPSVDIITGTIKANFPTRISFKVTSKVDSRTILNEQGAEQLLGQGDMLYSTGAGQIIRVHGPFVSDEEVEAIADSLRRQRPAAYVEGIFDAAGPVIEAGETGNSGEDDLYDRAVAIVLRDRKVSTSYIQRRLSIGYNRAADLVERMERDGLISAANHVGKREILISGSGAADAA